MNDSLAAHAPGILSDGALWRSLGMLLLVLALLLSAVWFLRRLQRGASVRNLELEVMGQLPIAQKQFLSVVRVGKDLWVLGVSQGSIQYIGDYKGDLPLAEGAAQGGFASFLDTKLKHLGKNFSQKRTTTPGAGA